MKEFLRANAIALFLVSSAAIGEQAKVLGAPAYGSRFEVVKTYQEQAAMIGGTKAQQMEHQKNILKARYGGAGVQRMFGNYSPNPAIEGIENTLRLAASDNPNQAKGYKRTLLYESGFSRSDRFRVLGTDKPISTRFGKTDVDLWLEHRNSGSKVYLEVKDNKLGGQNVQDYKLKIRRLADYAKAHGGKATIVNRYAIKPEIKEFARANSVSVYEKVATGRLSGQKPGNMRFLDMEKHLSQGLNKTARMKLITSRASAAGGILILYTFGNALFAELELPHDDLGSWLRTGENALLFFAGGAMTTGELAEFDLRRAMRNRGGIIAALIIAEGIAIARDTYQWEHMSEGQKYVAWIRHGSNALLIGARWVKHP